jgi:hypothetical protein
LCDSLAWKEAPALNVGAVECWVAHSDACFLRERVRGLVRPWRVARLCCRPAAVVRPAAARRLLCHERNRELVGLADDSLVDIPIVTIRWCDPGVRFTSYSRYPC